MSAVKRRRVVLTAGDRVVVLTPHPWAGEYGVLVAFEAYGPLPPVLRWDGWRVELDNGVECYAAPEKLRAAP